MQQSCDNHVIIFKEVPLCWQLVNISMSPSVNFLGERAMKRRGEEEKRRGGKERGKEGEEEGEEWEKTIKRVKLN